MRVRKKNNRQPLARIYQKRFLCLRMMASNQAKEIDESSNIKLGNQKFGISTKKCC